MVAKAEFGPINIRVLSTLGQSTENHIRPNGSSRRAAYTSCLDIVDREAKTSFSVASFHGECHRIPVGYCRLRTIASSEMTYSEVRGHKVSRSQGS